jgi:C-terminal processing protease CtpA/Prc
VSRLTWSTCLIVALFTTRPAWADSVRVLLDLEGTLSERDGRFTLSVDSEGTWTVEVPEHLRDRVKDTVRHYPNGKVSVKGWASVRTAGAVIQLRDRTVEAEALAALLPGVRIQGIMPGTPAAGSLETGDIIREVGGEEITSYDVLLRSLDKQRGKRVNVVIDRNGKAQVQSVALRTDGPALGIYGRTVWTRGDVSVVSPSYCTSVG